MTHALSTMGAVMLTASIAGVAYNPLPGHAAFFIAGTGFFVAAAVLHGASR